MALLLWGVRMVRTGITRAYGADLRRVIGAWSRRRLSAFAAGLGVTAILQSSTATSLMVSSFAGRGLIPTVPALAVMLGANVGTTLVAQVLAFRPWWLAPALLVLGVGLFLLTSGSRPRHLGRVAIGLGLMLVALEMTVDATAPLRDGPALPLLLGDLAGSPLLAFFLAALLTWLAHSSLAIVLLVMSLASNHLVGPTLAIALVLGANVGGAIGPVAITAGADAPARRAQVGNLLMRLMVALPLLLLLPELAGLLRLLTGDPARQVVNAHTAFNLLAAVVMLPLLDPVARLCARLLPDRAVAEDARRPRHLDRDALDTPAEALAGAAREALRMGDIVEGMLRRAILVFQSDDPRLAKAVEAEDDVIDSLHEAVKLYLTEVSREDLDALESGRCLEILTFTTNLEHVGDIIDRNLMELAAKKMKHRLKFSPAGFAEIQAFHERVMGDMRLALNVFLSRDVGLARELVRRKSALRDAERRATEQHLARLGTGRTDTLETSSLHLDVIRDLKRINSHLTAVAYPILEAAGELIATRLRTPEPEPGRVLADHHP